MAGKNRVDRGDKWCYIGTMSPEPILPPRHSSLRVRITQVEREVLDAKVRKTGIPMSVHVRRALRAYLAMSPDAEPDGRIAKGAAKFLSSSDGRGGA